MLHYIEFDTTQQTLLADLRTQILTCTDWARLTPDTVLLATSAATAANATVLTFASTTSSLQVGSIISIDNGTLREYRTITAMTATTITVAAMSYAHAIGTEIRWGNELYKATTTRGAQMVVDFSDGPLSQQGLSMALYRSHDGTNGIDEVNRWLYWRAAGGVATQPLHVVLSLSKEHLFVSIEGPRAGEASPANGTYGSLRHYFFICDLIPYDATDTVPAVVAGGATVASADSSVGNGSHLIQVSRNRANTTSWTPGYLQTLDFPSTAGSETINVQRVNAAGEYILAPYVVFTNESGMRGRLNGFFFAGHSYSDNLDASMPPIGVKTQYQSQWYKLLAVNKNDALNQRHTWGQFGAAINSQTGTFYRSPVVAVPCLP